MLGEIGGEIENCLLGEVEGKVVGVTVPAVVGKNVSLFGLHTFLSFFPFQSHNGCFLQGTFSVKSEQETKSFLLGEEEC